MLQLKAFVGERLSEAAGEIYGEFERTLAMYKAELNRSKEEVDNLRKQLELQCEKSAAEPPPGNSIIIGEECDFILQLKNLPPSTPVEMGEESNFSPRSEVPGPSQTNAGIENMNLTYFMLKADSEISQIKEEQEELGIDSQQQETIFPSSTFVISEQDQPETKVAPELEPLSSDCSTDQRETSDNEDWVETKGEQTKSQKRKAKAVQRQTDRTMQEGNITVPCQGSSGRRGTVSSACHFCGKTFQYAGSLMKHIKTHDKTVELCGICRKTFKSTKELVGHIQFAHKKATFCHICGKTFSKVGNLKVHTKVHVQLKDFTCQDCGKVFFRKDHLIVHARTHSGEKPYRCDICGKAFSQSQNVAIHKRSHTGEKPYHCKICGRLFNTGTQLRAHMRYHSGEKPYCCDICGRHFRESGHMTRHKRIHTGEKPYACHVCDMRYRFGANLKVHMKVHQK